MFASRVPKRKEWSAIEATPSLRRDPDRLMTQWSPCGFLRGKVWAKVTSLSNVQPPLRVTAWRQSKGQDIGSLLLQYSRIKDST